MRVANSFTRIIRMVAPIVVSITNHHLLLNTLRLKYDKNTDHNDPDTDKCQDHEERFGDHSILGTQINVSWFYWFYWSFWSLWPFLSFWLSPFFWFSFHHVPSRMTEDPTEDPPV